MNIKISNRARVNYYSCQSGYGLINISVEIEIINLTAGFDFI